MILPIRTSPHVLSFRLERGFLASFLFVSVVTSLVLRLASSKIFFDSQ